MQPFQRRHYYPACPYPFSRNFIEFLLSLCSLRSLRTLPSRAVYPGHTLAARNKQPFKTIVLACQDQSSSPAQSRTPQVGGLRRDEPATDRPMYPMLQNRTRGYATVQSISMGLGSAPSNPRHFQLYPPYVSFHESLIHYFTSTIRIRWEKALTLAGKSIHYHQKPLGGLKI